jgi:Tfp pilus assembly protein PilF
MANTHTEDLERYVQLLIEQEQFAEAEGLLLEGLSTDPPQATLFLLQGDMFLAQGRSIEAQIFYEKALENESTIAAGRERLDRIQQYIQKLHLPAKELAQQIVAGIISEKDFIILLRMIRESDHQIELIDQIRHQLTINQDNWPLFWRLALEAKQFEQIEAVDDLCNKILSVKPDFWYAQELPGHVRGFFARADHDEFIEHFFKENPPRFKAFVETPALDGIHFSNVRRLHVKFGWSGICIEPTPEYFRSLYNNYRESGVICLNTPLKDIDGESPFTMPGHPASLDFIESSAPIENIPRQHPVETKSVKTLHTVLTENQIPGIDLLSINAVEGNLDILKGLHLESYQPLLIIINYSQNKTEIIQHLTSHGYFVIRDIGHYLFFASPAVTAPEHVISQASTEPTVPSEKKIVALLATQNDGLRLPNLLKSLSRFVDSIVVLDDNSTDTTLQLLRAEQSNYRIESILEQGYPAADDMHKKNLLLKTGRQLSGTHFLMADVNEILTANLLEGDLFRSALLELEPGESLALKRIRLLNDTYHYLVDESSEQLNYRTIAFADDGKIQFSSEYSEHNAVPKELHGKKYQIEGNQYGLLQYTQANLLNSQLYHAWQLMSERIRKPQRKVQEINQRFELSGALPSHELVEIKKEWIAGYPDLDTSVYSEPDVPRIKQMLRWFSEYDSVLFNGLDINDVDWDTLRRQYGKEMQKLDASGNLIDSQHIPESIDELMEAAVTLLHNKLPGQAEEYLRRILSIDQQNLAALNNLAVVKIMQEEFEAAQIILDRILQIHPGDENARENLQFLRKVRTLDRR